MRTQSLVRKRVPSCVAPGLLIRICQRACRRTADAERCFDFDTPLMITSAWYETLNGNPTSPLTRARQSAVTNTSSLTSHASYTSRHNAESLASGIRDSKADDRGGQPANTVPCPKLLGSFVSGRPITRLPSFSTSRPLICQVSPPAIIDTTRLVDPA
ncbi:hypothetical protein MKZ38_002578 [Zalerion maritima]|uniref:Uncharacterized protein n=1 Tax=Zalerion maritima TaxID=339359 RepID=A0AAD5RNP3_9PEZI|nr:hypothetical protein MKZ38_002578 [Zalerion maritima]